MKKIQKIFKDYHDYHRTKGNMLSHVVGVPMIVISILGFLDRFSIGQTPFFFNLSLALLFWAGVNFYYFTLHVALASSMLASTLVLYWVGTRLSLPWLGVFFVVGWVIQIAGHSIYEKKAPAFTKNFVHMLIGPLFVQNYLLKIIREKK